MNAPASIHDPVSPEQAKHLSGFYWNVRKDPVPARELAKIEHTKALTKKSNARAKARKQAAKARQVGA